MSVTRVVQAVLVAGLCVGALEAGAEEASKKAEAPAPDGVSFCVQMREQIFQCKEEFADAFVAMRNPPPEQRAALRKTALEEITADGSGPLPPRRQKCEAMGRSIAGEWLATASKKLDACGAIKDCRKRVPCIRDLLGGGKARPRP